MNMNARDTVEAAMVMSVLFMLCYSAFALALDRLAPPHAKLVVVGITTLGAIYFSGVYRTDDPWASRGVALVFVFGAIAALRSFRGDTPGGWVLIGAAGAILWAWAAVYLGDERAFIVRVLRRRGAAKKAAHEMRKRND